jgi:DNA polymerase (family X)
MPVDNTQIATTLNEIAELLEVKGDTRYRIYAYQRASEAISSLPVDVRQLIKEKKLQDVPGIGESIASKIKELVETGRMKYYEELEASLPKAVVSLMHVPGIGPKKAARLHNELGINSVEELEKAAKEGKISGLPGYGEKTEANILRDVQNVGLHEERRLLGEVLPVVEHIIDIMRHVPGLVEIAPAGSIRRREETVGDIDLVAASDKPEKIVDVFTKLGRVRQVLNSGPTKATVILTNGMQADIRVVKPEAYGSLLQHFTGNKSHNIILREYARQKGWSISEYGLTDIKTGKVKPCRTEEEVYETVGLQPMPPEIRLGTDEIEVAERHEIPTLVELKDIKGDLHVHSHWSDGGASLEEMVKAAKAKGYEYIAVCDHSESLAIANGLDEQRLRKQIDFIGRINESEKKFRVLCGIEANIEADGTVEVPPALIDRLDVVVASIHGGLRQTTEKITGRMVGAIEKPYVAIIGHPTGRIIGRRDPSAIDIDAVVAAARKHGTALEINGFPDRLDLRDANARKAKQEGVLLSTNSDAHSTDQLGHMRYAVGMARRGWLEAKDVLNTKTLDELLEWLKAKRGE